MMVHMKLTYVTMFPENYDGFLETVQIKRARTKGIVETRIVDIRDYADGSFRHLDDSPCGGGAGMVMRCEPVIKAIRSAKSPESRVILMDPCGMPFTQHKARELAELEDIVFVAGHYEGFDARIYDEADECISIGDYILTGGELASQVITDAVVRLLDGIIRKESTVEESFETMRLEYPQYTRPIEFEGKRVPDVLLSGNHAKINAWRKRKALERTIRYRKDLIEKYPLTKEENELLEKSKDDHSD